MFGVVAALWGINVMNSFGYRLGNELGMHDNTAELAIGAGVGLGLIGLVLLVSGGKQSKADHS